MEDGEALQEAGEASKTSVRILQETEQYAASTSSEQALKKGDGRRPARTTGNRLRDGRIDSQQEGWEVSREAE